MYFLPFSQATSVTRPSVTTPYVRTTCATQRQYFNLMTHTNPGGELYESHLGAAYAVALAAAVTGYRHNPKVGQPITVLSRLI